MKAPSEKEAIRQACELIAEWLGVDAKDISSRVPQSRAADAILEVGKHVFVVESKSSGAAAIVSDAAERVCAHAATVSKNASRLSLSRI